MSEPKRTRPRGEQVRFRSSKTGEHILDTYMEACEKGDRSLFDLLSDIFDNDGDVRADLYEFRPNPSNRALVEYRAGRTYIDPDEGWLPAFDLTTFAAVYRQALDIPGFGAVGELVNAINGRNFTGTPGAVGTRFPIAANAHLSFYYDGEVYDWVGPTGVSIGVGGTRVVVEGDLIRTGAGLPEAPLNGVQYARQNGRWVALGDVAGNFPVIFTAPPEDGIAKAGDLLITGGQFYLLNAATNPAWIQVGVGPDLSAEVAALQTAAAGFAQDVADLNAGLSSLATASEDADTVLASAIDALDDKVDANAVTAIEATAAVANDLAELDIAYKAADAALASAVDQAEADAKAHADAKFAEVSRPKANLLMNPFFEVKQRPGNAFNAPAYCADRWSMDCSAPMNGRWEFRINKAVDLSAYGKVNGAIMCKTHYTPQAGEFASFSQRIEGYVGNALLWGLAGAKPAVLKARLARFFDSENYVMPGAGLGPLVLSFYILIPAEGGGWHKGIVFPVTLPATLEEAVDVEFAIPPLSAALPGIRRENGLYCEVGLTIAAGYGADHATAGEWFDGDKYAHVTQTNGLLHAGQGVRLTDMSLTVGPGGSEIEIRPYMTELAMCQRYYQRWEDIVPYWYEGGVPAYQYAYSLQFPVQMRDAPTMDCALSNGDYPVFRSYPTGASVVQIATGVNVTWLSAESELD